MNTQEQIKADIELYLALREDIDKTPDRINAFMHVVIECITMDAIAVAEEVSVLDVISLRMFANKPYIATMIGVSFQIGYLLGVAKGKTKKSERGVQNENA